MVWQSCLRGSLVRGPSPPDSFLRSALYSPQRIGTPPPHTNVLPSTHTYVPLFVLSAVARSQALTQNAHPPASSWAVLVPQGGARRPPVLARHRRLPDVAQAVRGQAQVHLLRRTAVRDRSASLRPPARRNHQGEVSTPPSAPPSSLLFAHKATFAEKTEGDEMRV